MGNQMSSIQAPNMDGPDFETYVPIAFGGSEDVSEIYDPLTRHS